jgi:hypothetical protein
MEKIETQEVAVAVEECSIEETSQEQEEQIEVRFRYHPIGGWDEKDKTWRCCECGIDMGPDNSRQLCAKSRCMIYG